MTIQEINEKQGNWLFQRRSWFPLIFLAFGCAYYIPALLWGKAIVHFWWIDFLFLCVGFFGLGIRILTVGFTPKGTSGRNTTEGQVAEQLNTTGIYSIVRHPLYIGNFFMWLAPALVITTSNVGVTLFICLFFWQYYYRITFAEEQFLKRKFGQQYLDWAANTHAVFPKISQYKKSELKFSLKNVLKREYNSFFSLVFTMTAIRLTGFIATKKQIYLDTPWIIIISAAFIIFIALKMMKKYTKILEVEGR